MIIAIDGPAGAGKSTVARIIAQKLGFLYIDTGAMYRALTLKVLDKGINVNDELKIVELAKKTQINLRANLEGSTLEIFLDNQDVTSQIRQPRITQFVSDIAKIKGVREVMLELQRALGEQGDVVLDGRDIGTVVFPGADRKFYIDAKFNERVNRRYKELKGLGQEIDSDAVETDLKNRDTIDSTRKFAPLKKADDAIYIDTTSLSIEEVVDKLIKEIKC